MSEQKKLKLGIIGLGSRGDTFLRNQDLFNRYFDLQAIADIKKDVVRDFGRRHHVSEEGWFYSDTELFEKKPQLDAVIITTLDRRHHYDTIQALKSGYHVLLEKPIGVSEKECEEIYKEAQKHDLLVMVCHELRYTSAFQKIKELISAKVIGDLLTIQAKEQIGYWHEAHSFVRGNCGNADRSSFLFLQKCSHDMDLMYWLTDSEPKRVSSFGSLTHFTSLNAPKEVPDRCTDGCAFEAECPYSALTRYLKPIQRGESGWPFEMVVPVDMNEDNMLQALKNGPYGRCVYHCDNNVVDHQIVNLETNNGILISFTMSAFTNQNGRYLHFMGSEGDIIADIDAARTITVQRFDEPAEVIHIDQLDEGLTCSHGGGDDKLLEAWALAILNHDWQNKDITSLENSLPSHRICFAAERSRLAGGRPVEF